MQTEDVASFDVAGLGTVLMDHQVVLASYPLPDEKVPALRDRWQVGGPVPTALAQLSRFGHRCTFLGQWGNDPLGAQVEADLRAANVDARYCLRTESATGFAHVWLDQQTGTRTIAYSRGEAPPPSASIVPRNLPCQVLHLDGWAGEAALTAARQVKAAGGMVTLDAGAPKPATEELLALVDLVNIPARFSAQFGPTRHTRSDAEAADVLMQLGVRRMVFTHGEEGCRYFDAHEDRFQPAFPVTAVDTTGAGDIFCGGLLHGLLSGLAVSEMLRFAAATAAIKCEQLGNRDALASLSQVHDFLRKRSR